MTRLGMFGAETGSAVTEGLSIGGGSPSVVSSPVRSGNFAFAVPMLTSTYLQLGWTKAFSRWHYIRGWFRVSALPTGTRVIVAIRDGATSMHTVTLRTDGKLIGTTMSPGPAVASAAVGPGEWHCLEIGLWSDGTTTRRMKLLLDGVQFDESVSNTTVSAAGTNVNFGSIGTLSGETAITYWDDIAINDDTGAAHNSWPGMNGRVGWLKPVADVSTGSWRLGDESTFPTGNAWDSVDNLPPQGALNGSVGVAQKQISSPATISACDFALDAYDTIVDDTDVITAIRAIVAVTRHSAGSNGVTYGVIANPNRGTTTFPTITTGSPSAYPSNWTHVREVPMDFPTVVLADRPTVRVQGTLAAALYVCSVGQVIEYIYAEPTITPGDVVHDTFTDVDGTFLTAHTGEVGATWAGHSASAGTPRIVANRIRGAGGSNEHIHYASGVPASLNYSVTAVFRQLSVVANHVIGLLVRMSTSVRTWLYITRSEFSGTWNLVQSVNGSETTLDSYDGDEAVETDYTVDVVLDGTMVTVLINGVERMSATTVVTTSGRVGLYFYDDATETTGWQIGSLDVTNGEAPAATNPYMAVA